jgi:hypothetical protein
MSTIFLLAALLLLSSYAIYKIRGKNGIRMVFYILSLALFYEISVRAFGENGKWLILLLLICVYAWNDTRKRRR